MAPDRWTARIKAGWNFRKGQLDGEIFYTLKEAQTVIESWRRHYNAAV
jgi:hypothetical protein